MKHVKQTHAVNRIQCTEANETHKRPIAESESMTVYHFELPSYQHNYVETYTF